MSETSATGLDVSQDSRLDVSFQITPIDRTVRGKTRGYGSLRAADTSFAALAEAVVTLAVVTEAGDEPRQPIRRDQVQLELATPDQSVPPGP